MRTILIIAWLFFGLGAVIYHYGPGQKRVAMDGVQNVLSQARHNVSLEKYPQALEQFDKAMADLSVDNEDLAHRIQLEKAKAQMHAAQLPEARASLESLLAGLRSADARDEALIAETQQALANAQYYRTWLMRLEGQPDEVWKPEIEAARQHFTQLNQKSIAAGDTEASVKTAEDLEATVRLARMDLNDLQGLPLPNQ